MDLPSDFSAINQDDLNNIDVENAIDGNANSGDDADADNSGDEQGPIQVLLQPNGFMITPT